MPAITISEQAEDAIGRVVAAYAAQRSRQHGVAVMPEGSLAGDAAAAVLFPMEDGSGTRAGMGREGPVVRPHPVTRDVDWSALSRLRLRQPPGGWEVLVSDGETAVVACREVEGRRQAWISTSPDDWRDPAAWVVLWTAALDWVGEWSPPAGLMDSPGQAPVAADDISGPMPPGRPPGSQGLRMALICLAVLMVAGVLLRALVVP